MAQDFSQFNHNLKRIEYKGYWIEYLENNSCSNYDFRDGMNKGWRVSHVIKHALWVDYDALTLLEAQWWIDNHPRGIVG